jgi:hypothetical protein
MPYIKQEDRPKFKSAEVGMGRIESAGELNYFITRTCLTYMYNKGICYQTFNDIVGVLTCVVSEFYRRVIGDYEDVKVRQFGDVITKKERQVLGGEKEETK